MPTTAYLSPVYPFMQEWAVLDLYCGAGGSAYFGEGAPSTKARWAVDIQKDACSTYEANFQGVQVGMLCLRDKHCMVGLMECPCPI